jgi:hypothetical protein
MKSLIANPKNGDLSTQIATLEQILRLNQTAWKILEIAEKTIPYPWYMGGGGIYHTIWNYYSNRSIENDLKDYDIFYFNQTHNESEHTTIEHTLNAVLDDEMIDLTNIATVHTWLKDVLNKEVLPYTSIEQDINSFGNTVASIGVRMKENKLEVYAPYGLTDIFSLEVHHVGGIFTQAEYVKKAQSWQKRWPALVIHES